MALSLMVRVPFMGIVADSFLELVDCDVMQQTTTRNTASYRRRYGYRQPRPLPCCRKIHTSPIGTDTANGPNIYR